MPIKHGCRDGTHHLRLPGTRRVKQAAPLARLLLGGIGVYWSLCRLGGRRGPPASRAAVACGRGVRHVVRAMDLVAMGHAAVRPTARRRLHWVQDTLCPQRPPTPASLFRSWRFRPAAPRAPTA